MEPYLDPDNDPHVASAAVELDGTPGKLKARTHGP
jgi:hypothetical protein